MTLIRPDWPVPKHVRSFITTRSGGCSSGDYQSFNLATHVGDVSEHVQGNRTLLESELGVAQSSLSFHWLNQVHGVDVHHVMTGNNRIPNADASFTSDQKQVCVVMTADCLPVLLCNRTGTEVAAVHAGWKGLASGIISHTVKKFCSPSSDLMCYLAPCISQPAFQVGEDVRTAFLDAAQERVYVGDIAACFVSDTASAHVDQKKYFADLYALARAELKGLGVEAVYGGKHCTYREADLFFSYRRERNTGRMASGIWIDTDNN